MRAMRPRGWILAGATVTVGALVLGLGALLGGNRTEAGDPRPPAARAPGDVARVLPEAGELHDVIALAPLEANVARLPGVGATVESTALTPPPPGEPVRFTGRVLDEAGAPLPGARVLLVPDGRTLRARGRAMQRGSRVQALRPEDLVEATSAADGAFELVAHVVARRPGELNDAGNPRQPVIVVRAEGCADFGHVCLDLPGGRYDAGDLQVHPGAGVTGRVVDERGWPLAGARVLAAVADGGLTGRPPIDVESWLHTVTTGEDGRFRLDNLPCLPIELRLSSARHVPLTVGPFDVQAGGSVSKGDIVLVAGGEVAGTVLDPEGRPLAGARVAAVSVPLVTRGSQRDLDTALMQLRERDEALLARTDAAGRFRLGGLVGGNLSLVVDADGFEAVVAHDIAPFRQDVVLVVQPRAELLVQAVERLTRAPVPAALEARRALMVGWWTGQSELPVLPAEALPDRPGTWRVTGVGPLGAQLRLTAPGFAAVTVDAPGTAAGGRDPFVVEMEHGATLSGVVRDGEAQPIADAGLTLMRRAPGLQATGERLRSDEQGRFAFAGLAPGTYVVRGEARGHVKGESADLLLEPGRPAPPLELVLRRAGVIEGRLLAADGRPAAGETVRAWLLKGTSAKGSSSSRTDTAGRFVMRDLEPGTWEVSSERQGRAQALVEAGGVAQVELRMARPAVLHGTVLAAEGPLPDASVHAYTDEATVSTTSDDRGRYELVLDPGDWYVMVVSPEGGWQDAPVTLVADEHRTLDLLLPSGRLDVLARQPDGSPAAGAPIQLASQPPGEEEDDSDSWRSMGPKLVTDDGGHAVFLHLPAGTYEVSSSGNAWLSDVAARVVLDDRPAAASLELRPASRITGRVLMPAGLPAPDGTMVEVYVADTLAPCGGSPVRGGDGRFEIAGLEAGSYLITVHAGWREKYDTATTLAELPVTLETGQSREVVLAIR